MRHRDAPQTTLSSYCWECTDEGHEPAIEWSIKTKGHPFSSGSKKCDLCLTEKTTIFYADQTNLLNKRSELLEKCRHKLKFCLSEIEPKTRKKKNAPFNPP